MRTALVVVDMLNDFVDGVLGNPAAKEIIGPIASLAEQARVRELKGTKIPIEPISRDSKDFPAVGMTLLADDYVRSRVLAHDVPDSGGVFISPQQYRLPDGPNFGSVAR